MRKSWFLLGLTGLLLLSLTACVSKKKFREMEALKTKMQSMVDAKNKELKAAQAKNDSLEKEIKDCNTEKTTVEQERDRLRRDLDARRRDLDEKQKELDKLNASCDRLKDNYDQLKSQSSAQMQKMMQDLENAQADLARREARLAEVERKLAERDSVMNALQNRISDALLGFKDKGLTVEVHDGKVYVSLSNKLLFASGSTRIDPAGVQALRDLAGVLKSQPDISIMVEGHTDDVPVSNLGQIKDNWDLSVMRSTEVVRVLVEAGLQATRVVPAGRGEFIPKVSGTTPEARAANRRTEIIISPKLDELWQLVGTSR